MKSKDTSSGFCAALNNDSQKAPIGDQLCLPLGVRLLYQVHRSMVRYGKQTPPQGEAEHVPSSNC
jgi:hypothetical protein